MSNSCTTLKCTTLITTCLYDKLWLVEELMSSHGPTINLPRVLVVAKVIDFVVAPKFFLKNFDFLYEITFISLFFFICYKDKSVKYI